MSDWRQAIDPAETAVFLDVDGTLLGFKERPDEVVADEELRDLLDRLRKATSGALALVSGRTIADLDRIVAPLVLPAGGVHGAELRFADGTRETFAGASLAEVTEAAHAFVAAREGLALEEKGGAAFAVHFRHAPDRAEEVGRFLEKTVTGDLMVQHGKMVAEVKPKSCHKGIAIETLMRTPPFVGRTPLFVGDDQTDEHGMESVNRLGGISIKVGEEVSVARRRLADVSAVRECLGAICRSDHS